MKGKDYLEIRKKQDELLSQIDDSTPADDPKIKELLSLQKECDEFERENVHVGYEELNVESDIKTIVKVIRMAHEEGMNMSDFVSMALVEDMEKRGWKVGDFVRVTLTEDTLTVKNLHIE